MKSIIKYILASAIRDKIYLGIFIFLTAIFAISIFFGSVNITEQSNATIVYIAAASRFIIIFGMILFISINISKAIENKEIEFILSKPISRIRFILGYLSGFLITSIIIIFILAIAIFLILKVNKIGFLLWFLSLFLELIIITSFAILASLILQNSFTSILSTIAFYFISNMMGIFVMAIELESIFSQINQNFLAKTLKIISLIFPRLDLFTQSSWLIYGVENIDIFKIITTQSLIYSFLMIFMAFYDIKNKQF